MMERILSTNSQGEGEVCNRSQGILLIDKEKGAPSFRLVSILRHLTRIQKIGHSGTLDPFATGLMVMLIGRDFTRRSNEFLETEKEYEAVLHLGIATDTYDLEGTVTGRSDRVPSLEELEQVLTLFQGEIFQVPPMYSAKKVQGKKLYDLARSGITIERQPVQIHTQITLLNYAYPEAHIHVVCSKGTYIRSLAHDIGQKLGTGGHLTSLRRLRSGTFRLEAAIPQAHLKNPAFDITPYLLYGHRPETLILSSSETKANRSEALRMRRPFPDGKGDEENRLGEVVASSKLKFQADGSI